MSHIPLDLLPVLGYRLASRREEAEVQYHVAQERGSLMLQRLLGHTTLMMTNRYCQALGCYDAIEAQTLLTGG